MKIIGFNFTKMNASKERLAKFTNSSIHSNFEFTNLEKDSLDLIKEGEVLKLCFQFFTIYSQKKEIKDVEEKDKDAEVSFAGEVVLLVDKDESKEFDKTWKKKQIPEQMAEHIINVIFRRCMTKAISFQDELGIPSPFLKIPPIGLKYSQTQTT